MLILLGFGHQPLISDFVEQKISKKATKKDKKIGNSQEDFSRSLDEPKISLQKRYDDNDEEYEYEVDSDDEINEKGEKYWRCENI